VLPSGVAGGTREYSLQAAGGTREYSLQAAGEDGGRRLRRCFVVPRLTHYDRQAIAEVPLVGIDRRKREWA
jgi:hypothetical protein